MGQIQRSSHFLSTKVTLCLLGYEHHFPTIFQAVELLSEVVQSCLLNEAEIEQQRGVVLRELEEVESNVQEVCLDLLHATAFQGTPLGHSVLGPSSNARQEELHIHLNILHIHLNISYNLGMFFFFFIKSNCSQNVTLL